MARVLGTRRDTTLSWVENYIAVRRQARQHLRESHLDLGLDWAHAYLGWAGHISRSPSPIDHLHRWLPLSTRRLGRRQGRPSEWECHLQRLLGPD
eukprot:5336350-Amphidinium_carterae.2